MKFAQDRFENDEDRAWYERLVRQVLEHPPSCLEGFRTERVSLEGDTWDDRVEWKIECPCGGESGKILGYPLRDLEASYEGPVLFVSPLAFQCANCDRVIQIIDTNKHGYDGECGHGAATIRGEGERATFACQFCCEMTFRVATSFQHSHFDIIEDEPELEPVAQNYFDWFACKGVCTNCGEEQGFGDYELA
jgi:hypothetical protein